MKDDHIDRLSAAITSQSKHKTPTDFKQPLDYPISEETSRFTIGLFNAIAISITFLLVAAIMAYAFVGFCE